MWGEHQGSILEKSYFSLCPQLSTGQFDNELNVTWTITAMSHCSSIRVTILISNHEMGAVFKINYVKTWIITNLRYKVSAKET